jgi:hypothetical protein
MAFPFPTGPPKRLPLVEIQEMLVCTQYPETADGPFREIVQQGPGHVVSEPLLGVL